jgi:hypothetical protein
MADSCTGTMSASAILLTSSTSFVIDLESSYDQSYSVLCTCFLDRSVPFAHYFLSNYLSMIQSLLQWSGADFLYHCFPIII